MAELPQVSLSAGELSPSMYGRVDLARYLIGLRKCLNFVIRPQGGAANRSGTRFVNSTGGSPEPRLIPFVFSTTQTYFLEFGAGYIKVFSNGAHVPSASTVNITAEAPGDGFFGALLRIKITTSAPHLLGVGDLITIAGVIGTGDYDTNGPWMVSVVGSSTTFEITPGSVPPIGTYTSGGTVSKALSLSNPYGLDDLDELNWTQSADVLTVVHPDFPQYEFRRLSATAFTFTPIVYESGPFESINDDETIFVDSSALSGSVTLTSTADIFLSTHIGALFYLEQRDPSAISPWEPSRRITATGVNCFGQLRRSDEKNYQCVTDFVPATNEVITGTVRPTHERGVASDGNGQAITGGAERAGVDWLFLNFGFGIFRITGYTDAKHVTAAILTKPPASVVGGATTANGPYTMTGDGVDVTLAVAGATSGDPTDWEVTYGGVIQPFDSYTVDATTNVMTFLVAPANGISVSARQLSINNRSDLWAFGAWSEANGYPSETEFYGDRQIFAATRAQPQTAWFSKVGDYSNFVTSRPVVDDDTVSGTINARQVNKITNIVPLDSLLFLTKGSEWRATAGSDDVITPSSIGFKPQSFNGASALPAQIIDSSAIYVQDRGFQVRDLLQTVDPEGSTAYSGNDLTVTAEHLTQSHIIKDWTYQALPFKTVWMCREDGVLLSLTYMREHQVVGWAQHQLGDGGKVRRLCCIPEGQEDSVYMVVERVVGGVTTTYIEKLTSRVYTNIVDAVFMDSSLTYDGRNTTSGVMTLTGSLWTVADTQTLNSSISIFGASSVGDQIILNYGEENELRLRITAYLTPNSVTVNPLRDVPIEFQGVPSSTNWAFAHDTFGGLEHLDGLEVIGLSDGNVTERVTVEDGQVVLDNPGAVVTLGLPYDCDLETLDLNIQGGSIRDRAKAIPGVSLIVQESRGIFAGPDADHLLEFVQRENENYTDPTGLLTGLAKIYVDTDWNKDGRVFIRQKDPLPLTVLSITPEVKLGGTG